MEYFSVSKSSGILLSDDSQLVNTAKGGHDSSRSIETYETGSETGNSKQPAEKGPKKRKVWVAQLIIGGSSRRYKKIKIKVGSRVVWVTVWLNGSVSLL